jgi:hypothetical protein
MNPERVIENQADREALRAALLRFGSEVQTSTARRDAFLAAGVTLLNLRFTDDAVAFADTLTARLISRPLSAKENDTHPLLQLVGYFLRAGPVQYGFFAEDEELFTRIAEEGQMRLGAVRARASVANIADMQHAGVGTGVLIGPDLLLTCDHVLSKTRAARAWAVFGHKQNWDGHTISPGTRFELDLKNPACGGGGTQPDFVLLRILQMPNRAFVAVDKRPVHAGQPIRVIHHPGGQPAVVSPPGQVTQVGADYLYHNLDTDEGSSGAPLFDVHWQLLALHQGIPPGTPAGQTAGVPVNAFVDALIPHLTP